MDIDNFFQIETKEKLFDFTDVRGFPIWDIFRYYVRSQENYSKINTTTIKHRGGLKKICFLLVNLLTFLFHKKSDLFFLTCSRDRSRGVNFDKISDGYINYYNKKNIIIGETYCLGCLSYKTSIFIPYIKKIFLKFHRVTKITHKELDFINKVIELFPESQLNQVELISKYYEFLNDYNFYTFIFKYFGTKKVFMVQNGIQKGLIQAAHELNIPIIELQHGTVEKGHLAYSYPNIEDIRSKIIFPDKILRFSDFWFSNFNCPTELITVGNDYMSKTVNSNIKKNKILVISADLFGLELATQLVNIVDEIDKTFIFKLHPNEYQNIQSYMEIFKDKKNIQIIRNEHSVNDLLNQACCMITVCSTAAYEALQAAVPVYILKTSIYNEMKPLFDIEGLYLFDSCAEMKIHLISIPRINKTIFFNNFRYVNV